MNPTTFRSLWRWWLPPIVVLGGLGLLIAVWTASLGDAPIVYETVPGPPP